MSRNPTVEDAVASLQEQLMDRTPREVGFFVDQVLMVAFISWLEPSLHEFMSDLWTNGSSKDDVESATYEKFENIESRYRDWLEETQIAIPPRTELWLDLNQAVDRFWELCAVMEDLWEVEDGTFRNWENSR